MSDNDMNSEEQRQLKNAVFAAKAAAEGKQGYSNNGPEVTREEYIKRELGFEIPTDLVPLPSKGLIYPPNHALHNQQAVEYRAMTAKEEDILMSRALIKKGTVINELIKSCLVGNNINVPSLVSGDRNALMIAIRISGYGADYNPSYVCPGCSANNELHVNLSDLELNSLTIDPVEPFKNHFEFKLPVSKKTVGFKFLTGEEEEKILKGLEAKRKKSLLNDNVITTRLLNSIVEIDGSDDRNAIARFVQYMPARDSLELRHYIDKHEPGVDMSFDFECEYCDFNQQMQIPLGSTFLWPSR